MNARNPDPSPRTAVLLGAGASADAGLPLTNEFAEQLVRRMQTDKRTDHAITDDMLNALHFVYSAMVGHRGEAGGDPLVAVNVETMFSAIRLLRHRHTHEVAPFIAGWKSGVDAFDTAGPRWRSTSDLVRGAQSAVLGQFTDGRALAREIKKLAREEMGGGDGATYTRLEEALLVRVRRLLSDPVDVAYLAPLLALARTQPGGLTVGTLNYDLTVEMAAEAAGVAVNIGVDGWGLGTELVFPGADGQLDLIKLHGSIDWGRMHPAPRAGRFITGEITTRVEAPADDHVPAIVIGDREKLETDGPTLALLHAFQRALDHAYRLVVVGYSFGDAHVNAVVRDWINSDSSRTLTVLDPGWPLTPEDQDYRAQLTRELGLELPDLPPPRLHVVRETTRAGLQRALTEAPLAGRWPRFAVEIDRSSDELRVRVRNDGVLLRNVQVTVPRRHWSPDPVEPLELLAISPDLLERSPSVLEQDSWASDATIEFVLRSREARAAELYSGFMLEGRAPVQRVAEYIDEDGRFVPVAMA